MLIVIIGLPMGYLYRVAIGTGITSMIESGNLWLLMIGLAGLALFVPVAIVLEKRIKIWLFQAGTPKLLKEKEIIETSLDYFKTRVMAQGVVGREPNVVGLRIDGDHYDNPYAYVAITTEQFKGTRKLSMDEITGDKLFFIYVDRLGKNRTYLPNVNDEESANLMLKDMRVTALPYDKARKQTELEALVEKEKATGYGKEQGKELAQDVKK